MKTFFNHARSIAIYLFSIIVLAFLGIYFNWPEDINNLAANSKANSLQFSLNPNAVTKITGEITPDISTYIPDSTELSFTVVVSDSSLISTSVNLTPKHAPINERKLLWLIILVGALGSSLHGITSISSYVGNDKFETTWTMWYILRPFTGAILSLLFYLIIRAGFFQQFEKSANFYTVLALSGMIGMFSKQALNKLSDLFDFIFQSDKEKGYKGKLNSNPIPKIESVEPGQISKNITEQELTITGNDFVKNSSVRINNKDYKAVFISPKQLSLSITAEDIRETTALQLAVFNPPPEGGLSNTKNITIT